MLKLVDIRRNAAARPAHVAVVDGETRLTWQQFEDQVSRVVAGLHAVLPPERPARAAFAAGNSWQLVVVMAACATLGIPCAGLDFTATPEATARALEQLRPTVLFSTAAYRPLLEAAGTRAGEALAVHLDGRVGSTPTYAALAATEPREVAPVEQPFAMYCFTSGTSGTPRMVIRHSSFEARRLALLVEQFAFDKDDVHLVTVPLHHSSGPGWARVFLALGGRIVLCPLGDPALMARLIRTEGVTTTLVVPPALAALVSHPASADLATTSRLRFVLSGGRHLNRWLVETAWDRLGPVLHLYYGTTETGVNTLITPDELHTSPGRAGRAMEGSAVAVVDSQGHLLPPGTRGRVAIASYQLMDDYGIGRPVFLDLDTGDGEGVRRFLLTGDSGVLDDEGRLELTGRTDGVSKVDGTAPLDVNVFGLEYDLMDLPCVRDTAVLRVDLPELGDALIVPFVPISLEREAGGYRAVEAACARRVPCLPAYVVPVASIPYSPTGKVRAGELLTDVLPGVLAREQRREGEERKEERAEGVAALR
ncbi:class I adenylate-forming enzyme family protein [Streptomyces sp. RKAG290]|uniref:class I adenylate-forming enzyme family protein n=1 Tax=Streptomyces sp. RKAG290 TaxID=2888348 RepID=UPI0020347816|nr:class I adenylate-forming enzyme family protein [Streptomyces sp. RKAG290]MCM2413798.1 acyl--CoA ligase [Streptomyces sp. RKAG290]